MQTPRPLIVFTTLALNQTTFFGAVGEVLQRHGFSVSFICFHDRSTAYLRRLGLAAVSVYECKQPIPERIEIDRFGIERVNMLLSHEKVAFGVQDSAALMRKLWRLLNVVDGILEGHSARGPVVMVQEFGGFLSLIAAFYAARARGFDNIFIEPSFFRGRVALVRNSFNALTVEERPGAVVSEEVNRYINLAVEQQQLVIPKKDAHHYRSAFEKILDLHNIRRLVEKSFDKHVLQKREEFEHIATHVGRHLRMLINGSRIKRSYQNLSIDEPFVYYPLHVPNDAALTVRSPEFLDQYALLDYLARILPYGHKLVIKEHPALVGAIDYRRISGLLKANDNIKIVPPTCNSYEVMAAASAVITVNSKSGAEALLLGKPVIVLGDAFYRRASFAFQVDRLSDLPGFLCSVVKQPRTPISQRVIRSYFQQVWDSTFPGELYYNEASNVDRFAGSLGSFIEGRS
jgi:hypothetical protein